MHRIARLVALRTEAADKKGKVEATQSLTKLFRRIEGTCGAIGSTLKMLAQRRGRGRNTEKTQTSIHQPWKARFLIAPGIEPHVVQIERGI